MKKMLCLLLTFALMTPLTACHKHVPGPEATCTTDQICLECEKVLVEALRHEPGPEATCAAPQICLRCGEIPVTTM